MPKVFKEALEEPHFSEIAGEGEIAQAIIQVVRGDSVPADDLYFGLRKPVERLMEKCIGSDDRFAQIIRKLICENRLNLYIRKSETLWFVPVK